jgi:hypothetical protein
MQSHLTGEERSGIRQADDDLFRLKLANIPLINLRMEFNFSYEYVFDERLEEALEPPVDPIAAPMMIWEGAPEGLLTLLLQRAILGIEAYLPAAVKFATAMRGTYCEEVVLFWSNLH